MSLLDKIVEFILEVGTKRKRDQKNWFKEIRESRLRWFIKPEKMKHSDNYIAASKELSNFFQSIRQDFGLSERFM